MLKRATYIHVLIIAIVLSAITVGVGIFVVLKPLQKQVDDQRAIWDAEKQYTDQTAVPNAEKALKDAEIQVAEKQVQYQAIMDSRNSKIDLSGDRIEAWHQYAKELTVDLGPRLNNWWMRDIRARRKGANVAIPLGPLEFPGPVSSPDEIDSAGRVLTIPLAQGALGTRGGAGSAKLGASLISVIGTYQADLANVESWNHFSRLVQIDGLTLSGYSPFVTATYQARIYEFYLNSDKAAPKIGKNATGGSSSSGGAAQSGARSALNYAPPGGASGGAPGTMTKN